MSEDIQSKKKSTLNETFKAISMLKNNKEYSLFEALNNTNAGISFAQLLSISPSLRKICMKGLKLNSDDIRQLKMMQNLPIKDEEETSSEDTTDESIPEEEQPHKLYSIKEKVDIATVIGFVDKTPTKVLIDTGSGVNVIKKEFYNKISDKHKIIHTSKTSFKLASNAIAYSNSAVELNLVFDKLKISSIFWILEDSDPAYDVILGRELQKEHRIYIDPDDDCLYKKRDNKKPLRIAAPARVPKIINSIYYISHKLKESNIPESNITNSNPNLDKLLNSYKDILYSNNKIESLYFIPSLDLENYCCKINSSGLPVYSISKYENSSSSSEEINKDKDNLNQLINNFKDVLIVSIDDVKIAKAEPHSIPLSNNTPIKLRPYRISLEQSQALKKEIKKLLDHGLIIPSHSPWAFPVLLVKKKNGEWRMCVDYRKLNQVTIKDAYALPFIDELLESVHGAKYFSALDLFSGYHQIPMDPKDIEKTSFTTKFGNYNFVVMPFGLTNAPASFQREMNRILMPLIGKCLFVYMDDILVYSPTLEQHLKDLENVFSIMRKYNFSINLNKCEFCKNSVEVLGHILSDEGLKPVPNKVFAISSWKTPTNVTQLQSFLGLVSYYRKFIPNFASLADILYKLTSKNSSFAWTNDHSVAFELLKKSLCSNPILKYPDPKKPFIIRTDASSYAVGVVLLQYYKDSKKEHPIYFYSRCLKKAELNYSVTEKEGVAVIFALKKLRPYIAASPFPVKLYTDHKPLVGYFNKSIPLNDRHLRWISIFNEFKIEIIYEKGKNNIFADALSRIPSNNILTISTIQDAVQGNSVSSDDIPPPVFDYIKDNYSVLDGKLVYRDKENKYLTVVDKDNDKHDLVVKAHLVGHEGIAKTLARLKEAYYWPGMKSDVEKVVKTCLKCQCYRPSPIPKGTSTIPTVVERPFVRVGLDIIGPLPETTKGNKFIFSLTDYFTKWIEAKATKTIDTTDVTEFLEEVFSRHGIPEIIITDNGRQFIADMTKAFIDLYGSWVRFISPRHPEANGQAENSNREIVKVLRHICERQKEWDNSLSATLWALRTSKSSVTGFSSFELLYGRKDLWPLSVTLPDLPKESDETDLEYNVRRFIRHQKWIKEAIENIQYAHTYWLQRAKSSSNMLHKYKPGDLVLIRYINRKKLDPYFIGPFRVLKSSKYNTLVLQTLDKKTILERNIHIKDVKPYLVSI